MNKKYEDDIRLLYIFLLFMGFISGIFFTFAGLHAIDMNRNYMYFSIMENVNLNKYAEHTADGTAYDIPNGMYILGFSQLLIGIALLVGVNMAFFIQMMHHNERVEQAVT